MTEHQILGKIFNNCRDNVFKILKNKSQNQESLQDNLLTLALLQLYSALPAQTPSYYDYKFTPSVNITALVRDFLAVYEKCVLNTPSIAADADMAALPDNIKQLIEAEQQ